MPALGKRFTAKELTIALSYLILWLAVLLVPFLDPLSSEPLTNETQIISNLRCGVLYELIGCLFIILARKVKKYTGRQISYISSVFALGLGTLLILSSIQQAYSISIMHILGRMFYWTLGIIGCLLLLALLSEILQWFVGINKIRQKQKHMELLIAMQRGTMAKQQESIHHLRKFTDEKNKSS